MLHPKRMIKQKARRQAGLLLYNENPTLGVGFKNT